MGDGDALHQAATALPLVRDGLVLATRRCGWIGCWPGSVVAVYRGADAGATACCATFAAGADEGAVEASVVHQLQQALRQRP